jgi:hypothetical protein
MSQGSAATWRRAARKAVELFKWWCAELRDIGQWVLRVLPSRRSPEILLRVSGNQVSMEQREGESWKPVLTFALTAVPPELSQDLKGARTAIGLGAEEFYIDDFELPMAAARNLVAVVDLQLERRLPLPLSTVHSAHEVDSVDKKRGVMSVRVAVAHRDRIEQLRDLAVKLGLNPIAAGLLVDGASLRFNLLRRRRDPVRWSVTTLDVRLLKTAGAAAVLLAVVAGAQWIVERIQVHDEVQELRLQAERLRATQDALTAEAKPLRALQTLSDASAAPELLALLSSAIPAPNWFSHVSLNTPASGIATLELTGEVASTEQVVQALQAVPGIRDVKTSSAFSGEILKQHIELTAQYMAPDLQRSEP